MKRLAILGAAGTIGQLTRQTLLERTNFSLVLYARQATERLQQIDAARETIIDGDFLDLGRLVRALQGCQSVFLTDIHDPRATLRVIEAMKLAEVSQLISVAPEKRLCTSEALKQLADLTAPFLAPEKHQLLLQQKNRLMSYQLIVGSELAVRFVHLPSMEECMLQPVGWQEAVVEEMLAMYHCYTA
ncbi:NAD(P)H-binding protein [Enterococcus casseliflavus]|uniref:NAD(P)-binding domain-containing protein n=1 Tax=Enterococcus casseliflavus TaxID=37734 RepID=A0A6N3FWW1_ENTCA|nr:NAD(P)H-binding protein [Enterococcus casseliflavus]MBN2902918.1 NAD(P)H-binding protein [Enterococcus sp.]MDB1691148.1 NAD(P)H-binding protein [Enterococcus casseliflavus]NKD39515.1 NAD(P)H-binding protein [Enterococcus casseliflavus]